MQRSPGHDAELALAERSFERLLVDQHPAQSIPHRLVEPARDDARLARRRTRREERDPAPGAEPFEQELERHRVELARVEARREGHTRPLGLERRPQLAARRLRLEQLRHDDRRHRQRVGLVQRQAIGDPPRDLARDRGAAVDGGRRVAHGDARHRRRGRRPRAPRRGSRESGRPSVRGRSGRAGSRRPTRWPPPRRRRTQHRRSAPPAPPRPGPRRASTRPGSRPLRPAAPESVSAGLRPPSPVPPHPQAGDRTGESRP